MHGDPGRAPEPRRGLKRGAEHRVDHHNIGVAGRYHVGQFLLDGRGAHEPEYGRYRHRCEPVEQGVRLGELGRPESGGLDPGNHLRTADEMHLVASGGQLVSDPQARRQVAAAIPARPHEVRHI
jgi:hypothetical protein